MNYPWFREDAIAFGIVNVSVANMRAQSVFQAELVNQTLLGNIVSILDKRDDYLLVQNWDGYIGWISKHEIVQGDAELAREWHQSEKVMMRENYGLIYRQPADTSQIVSDLVPCIFLRKVNQNADYTEVELPDRQKGYVKASQFIDEVKYRKLKISHKNLIKQAQKFLGIPYLWGGNSSKGFDCSGFVQTVFRLFNFELPRDSGPMSREGKNIPLSEKFQEYAAGDLLFFGKTAQRINHVAIYMGEGLYIHSRGKVGINSLVPGHPLYEEYLRSLFVKVQRII
jgi:SH3-like domain-containing protein